MIDLQLSQLLQSVGKEAPPRPTTTDEKKQEIQRIWEDRAKPRENLVPRTSTEARNFLEEMDMIRGNQEMRKNLTEVVDHTVNTEQIKEQVN